MNCQFIVHCANEIQSKPLSTKRIRYHDMRNARNALGAKRSENREGHAERIHRNPNTPQKKGQEATRTTKEPYSVLCDSEEVIVAVFAERVFNRSECVFD